MRGEPPLDSGKKAQEVVFRLPTHRVTLQTNPHEVVFRADAAFAKPEIYVALEERGVKYATRLPANENLEQDIEELLRYVLPRRFGELPARS